MTLKIGKTNQIPAFLAMQVMQDAQRLEATGQDIMHLEVGQPSTPPPDAVNIALSTALAAPLRMAIRWPLVTQPCASVFLRIIKIGMA